MKLRKKAGPVSPYNTTVQKNVVHKTAHAVQFRKPPWNEDHKNIDLFMALVLQSRGQFVFPALSRYEYCTIPIYFPSQKVQIISINNLFLVAAAATDFAFFSLLCIPSDSPPSPPLPNMTGELFLQKNIPEGDKKPQTGSPKGEPKRIDTLSNDLKYVSKQVLTLFI